MTAVVLSIKRATHFHINISHHPSTSTITNHNIMSTTADSSLPDSICANCGEGEESSGNLKACTACKMVKYCNRDCQIAHRPQHKKKCKKRAAEIRDEKLCQEPPPPEECPICMLPPPLYDNATGMAFNSCCGKLICIGCIHTIEESGMNILCAYCRTPYVKSNEEEIKRLKKLMEKGNGDAFYQLAGLYAQGIKGMPQNHAKANELYLKAGELGCAGAYYNLGQSYQHGDGVEIDKKKAKHYWELAAINGDEMARHNLGCIELEAGNHQRAYKHCLIAASAGYKDSLDMVRKGYRVGQVTKEQYANTLREYQKSQDETKSEARDKARAVYYNEMHG